MILGKDKFLQATLAGCAVVAKLQLRLYLIACFLVACLLSFSQKNYTSLVNPFIGTGGHGHTYPGATLPFGMMQLSPDTRLKGWDGASGYHYSDSIIYGFSHTHLSGTGAVDYGDVLLMPFTGTTRWNNSDYASPFSHKNEKASPGYYEVLLQKDSIIAQLTTTLRAGMHQYTFPSNAEKGALLIDLEHRDEVLESWIEKVSDTELRGYRRSRAWAQDQRLYFFIRFETPITEYTVLNDGVITNAGKVTGKKLKIAVRFGLDENKTARVKLGISGVDEAGARRNLQSEITTWNFNSVRNSAEKAWNDELGKIEVTGGTRGQEIIFYTALYHTLVTPNIYQDVDGRFRSTDLTVHNASHFTNYTAFSLWDTYRALHPLMTITHQKLTSDWINTFLAQYKYGGLLPVWELSGNETFTMNGYHSVAVIWDAYQKGIRGFDAAKALEAAISSAEMDRAGLRVYREQGYVSNDKEPESVSKTVEYAYDDWCIAQLAKKLGKQDLYKKYLFRSQAYKNLFDAETSHIRGKRQAQWHSPFEAREINTFFTEGNAWQYAFAAPQDVAGLIRLYGGDEAFTNKLDALFTASSKTTGFANEDVSGLIGQYAQGNEPSHHVAYLFSYAGKPWRTQELIHRINKEFYKNQPDGLIGNEDCGQMSAWFVLSSIGFYPVCPGNGDYVFGTPLFDEVKIHLENGNTFTVKAKHQKKAASYYIQSATLNNKSYTKSWLAHNDLMKGGTLQFELHDRPNKSFGKKQPDRPVSAINDFKIVVVPYFKGCSHRFTNNHQVEIVSPGNAPIYYVVSGSSPSANSTFRLYTKPFTISKSCIVKAYTQKDGVKSNIVKQTFTRLPEDKTIKVLSKVNPMYTAGEPEALIDGVLGTVSWRTGEWQSYPEQDFEAIIDLKKVKPVSYAGVHVFQFLGPSIVYPSKLIVEGSVDGDIFFPITAVNNTIPLEEKAARVNLLGSKIKAEARYIKVKAVSAGRLPAWHSNPGAPTRIFISEVVVK
jgi:predicted alpha-1,2-mannosidase